MTLYEIKYAELETELSSIVCDCYEPECKNKKDIKRLVLTHKIKKAIVRSSIPFDILKNEIEIDNETKEPFAIVNNELIIKGTTEGVKSNKVEFQLCRPKLILIDFKEVK
jgi:hypothetical protein